MLQYKRKKGKNMEKYIIFSDSASDLTTEMRKEFGIPYLRMGIKVNDKEYHADLDFKEFSHEDLYGWPKNDNLRITTSLVSSEEIKEQFEPYLKKGIDIIYIGCTSVLSGTVNFVRIITEELLEQYPERQIAVLDSNRAGMAQGLLTIDAVKLQRKGASFDEVVTYVETQKLKYNLCGTLETLKYLKKFGRVSGAAAFFADLFDVKPIIISDTLGHNYVTEKVRGTKKAYNRLFEIVKDTVEGIEKPVIYIGQGVAQAATDYFKRRFTEELNAKVVEYWVGPIIGVACGPGTTHIVCYGKEVTVTSPKD